MSLTRYKYCLKCGWVRGHSCACDKEVIDILSAQIEAGPKQGDPLPFEIKFRARSIRRFNMRRERDQTHRYIYSHGSRHIWENVERYKHTYRDPGVQ